MLLSNGSGLISRSLRRRNKRRKSKSSQFAFQKLEDRKLLNATPLANHDLDYTTALNTALTISNTNDGVLDNDVTEPED